MIVRSPRTDDAASLVALVDALNLHEGDPRGHFDEAAVQRDVLAPDAPLNCVVADDAGALIGYAFWHFAYETAYAARGAHVVDLYVAEGNRGTGVGRGLLAAVAHQTKSKGGDYLWLTAYRSNAKARAFYRAVMNDEEDGIVAYALTGEPFAALAADDHP